MVPLTMLPLTGLRVLDLSRLLAGPFCTTILADLGADVIKAEALPGGDLYRGAAPFDKGQSVSFLAINRNKRSIGIDFRNPEGLGLLRRLAREVDVVVENFKPGVMEEMGLSYDSLATHNPRLIYASISGFGRNGPYGLLPGVDQIAQGMSGLMSLTGQPASGATRVGVPIGDLVAGMWTAIGVQSALLARHASGRGQRVDTSLLSALVGLLCVQGQRYLSLGEIPTVAGNHHPVSSPYGLFHAKDGVFNLSAATGAMWVRLCRHLGLEALIEDPQFATSEARQTNRIELERILDERFVLRNRDDWIAELRGLGIPAGPVYNLAEVFADPQVVANHMVETIDHPVVGQLRQLASPLQLDGFDQGSVRRPPPLLGQHTDEILAEFGVPPAQIAALKQAGAVNSADKPFDKP